MLEANDFTQLVAKVRAGDGRAAAELVRGYEPYIRREVRLHLLDNGLRRTFDSMDVCQSVLASFFLRASAGEYDLEQPDQLVRLLVVMARNKLASLARRQTALRRSNQGKVAADEGLDFAASPDPTPSAQVIDAELLSRAKAALSEEERRMVEARGEGRSWAEIAEAMGGKPQARRVQLSRAMDRIAAQFGLDE